MKQLTFGFVALSAMLFACSNNNQSTQASKVDDTTSTNASQIAVSGTQKPSPLNEALTAYLQIKNALANDNGAEAAAGGNAFVAAIDKIDKSNMTDKQKQTFDDAAADAKEMAEHIGKSADRIAHQREHFDMLSQDMYDLVKAFGSGQTLYKDFCPMYNNNKGAAWISETKAIKNPYLGKEMPTCGEVKEEMKQP